MVLIWFVLRVGVADAMKCTGDDALIPAAGAATVTPAWAAATKIEMQRKYLARALI